MVKPLEIVLIDDEPAIVRALSRVRSTRPGFRLLGFTESAAARHWLRDHTPALVITDHGTPGPNGVDIARTLRAQPRTRGVPILMLTGLAEGTLQEEAVAAGVTCVAHKPLGMREFHAHVERMPDTPSLTQVL